MCTLTAKQVDAIVETWKVPAENYYDSGEYILYRFFERNQDYQTYFRKFKYTALEDLKGKAGFREHASKLMEKFGDTIDCLQNDQNVHEISKIWHAIGENHKLREIPKAAFIDLKGVIIEILSEVCKLTDEQKGAWNILLDYCFAILFEHLQLE